jgi:hypothetical protein
MARVTQKPPVFFRCGAQGAVLQLNKASFARLPSHWCNMSAAVKIARVRRDGRYSNLCWIVRCLEIPCAELEVVDESTVLLKRFKKTTYVRIGDGLVCRDDTSLLHGVVTRIGLNPDDDEDDLFVIEIQRCYRVKDVRAALGDDAFAYLLRTFPQGLQVDDAVDMFLGMPDEMWDIFPDCALGKITVLDKDMYAECFTKPEFVPGESVYKVVARYDAEHKKLSRVVMKVQSLVAQTIVSATVCCPVEAGTGVIVTLTCTNRICSGSC